MKTICISSDDHRALSKIVNDLIRSGGKVYPGIQKLKQELDRAEIMDSTAIPAGTVTLNSLVKLRDMDTGELEEWILTMPEHADLEKNRISILAPIGTGILGFSEGDEIEWETPGGVRDLKVESVRHGAFSAPDYSRSLYG